MSKLKTLFYMFHLVSTKLEELLAANYVQLFRGSSILIGFALFTLSQHTPDIMQYDLNAKTAAFEFKEKTGFYINEVNCEQLKSFVKLCLLAKHQETTVAQSTKLMMSIFNLLYYGGLFLLILSVVGFFSSSSFETAKSENSSEN